MTFFFLIFWHLCNLGAGEVAVVTLLSFPGTHIKICRMGVSDLEENPGASGGKFLGTGVTCVLLCF